MSICMMRRPVYKQGSTARFQPSNTLTPSETENPYTYTAPSRTHTIPPAGMFTNDMNGDVDMAAPSLEPAELRSRTPVHDNFDLRHATNTTPFPSTSPGEDGSAPPSPIEGQTRTVRKKKSSLDLRDIYCRGGLVTPSRARL
ncbi:hypothetical protein FOMPIDRAFT_1049450 [Fomitopsis schrenkii]|uniref:Uncharacterized protein n=1 Tax=Fomitopsis schrenkii TaxID=2126942 RepID=S8FGZ6_FOMSC|nr:hypothetical protein FOMPIDRAFT_1049450 [Fomitopsis schrenkii]